jgi:hypothetical protein
MTVGASFSTQRARRSESPLGLKGWSLGQARKKLRNDADREYRSQPLHRKAKLIGRSLLKHATAVFAVAARVPHSKSLCKLTENFLFFIQHLSWALLEGRK